MKILENISIGDWTTFKIGGRVRYFLQPNSLEECGMALQFLEKRDLPYFILGEGSNVLVGSEDFEGGVISTLGLKRIWLDLRGLHSESGVLNSNLAQFALEKQIQGLEFLYGMPGSIGGSTWMNARCFGSSISDSILEVKAIDSDLRTRTYSGKELDFGYKTSRFQKEKFFIVECLFQAQKGSNVTIEKKMKENWQKRESSGQFEFPSAGCIFKNNRKFGMPSGQIIDELGLKSLRIGDAQIYPSHGNFIINRGKASSKEVIELIQTVQKLAKKQLKIQLDCEIQFHGKI